MKTLNIKSKEKTYPVFIGKDIFNKLPEFISGNKLNENLFIIIDANVNRYYGKNIQTVLSDNFNKVFVYVLQPGEKSKSVKKLFSVYSSLIENNFGRDTLLISIGGGVTGDIAGFAASSFMRGIQLIHIPTTIIAAIDSSVGGKTGINYKNLKNNIGSFYHPEFILIDTSFFSTLNSREINSGVGEIIKYAFLIGEDFFDFIFTNIEKIYSLNPSIIKKIIIASITFKSSVVEFDEKEKDLRKILNLGHTFAHAIESEMNFRIKHGEAVIAGITAVLFLSNKVGVLSTTSLSRMLSLISIARINFKLKPASFNSIFEFMMLDKKNTDGRINFVLVKDVGNILIDINVNKSDIIYSLREMNKFLNKNSV